MKRITLGIFISVAIVCVWLIVSNAMSSRGLAVRVSPQVLSVLANEDSKNVDYFDDRKEQEAIADSIQAKIRPDPEETVLSIFSVNLDSDEYDEQVLAVKKKNDPSGVIHVIVVDYDESKGTWTRSWEGPTEATNTKLFSVKVRDVIGDHNQNLLCFGTNESTEQTLSVFWRTFTRADGLLTYKETFRLRADSIEVRESPRSEGYQLGQINGVSWPVIAWMQDPKSANPLDRVEVTWEWNYRSGTFEKTGQAPVKGNDMERMKLEAMISGSRKNFTEFLDGLWIRSDVDTAKETAPIIMFDSSRKSVAFHMEGTQAGYVWGEPVFRKFGVSLSVKNESVSTMTRFIDVELVSVDKISVRVYDNVNLKIDARDVWSGYYRKLTEAMPSPYAKPVSPGDSGTMSLSGTFKSLTGLSIEFTPPHFTMNVGSQTESGGFGLYALDDVWVLDMKIFGPSGSVKESRTFRAELKTEGTASRKRKVLTLTPARTGIKGLTIIEGTTLVLEQP